MAEFNLWLLIVGIAAGAAVMWLVIGTLARNDDEVDAAERQLEAGWIAETIEHHGGRAPVTLIEQVLALHRRYLQGGPGIPVPQGEPEEPGEADEALSEGSVEEPSPVTGSAEEVDGAGDAVGPERKRARAPRAQTASETTEAKAR